MAPWQEVELSHGSKAEDAATAFQPRGCKAGEAVGAVSQRGSTVVRNTAAPPAHKRVFSVKYILNYITERTSFPGLL